jgi:hypothetical protein
LNIIEFSFILISSFPKSNVSIFLWVSLKFLKRQYLSTVSLWNNLDLTVRNSPNISCFKSRIKENTGKFPEYHGEGSRKLSILYARLRHQCSSLNSDLIMKQ